jgi:8-oxo-dGTP diphosphatase
MILVSAAIIISECKILITKRNENMKLPNLWEFPGGKVKENETPEDCVIREVNEELGVGIKLHSYYTTSIHKYDFGEIQLISYIGELESGSIELREHAAYQWVEVCDLVGYEFAPADIPIINKLKGEGICHLIQD